MEHVLQSGIQENAEPILLVDDNTENLRLLEKILEWGGFTNVRSVSSGQEGVEVLRTHKPHLIILDLMMPGFDGYQVLEVIRNEVADGAELPVLVFTADLNPEAKVRALKLGASDFLTKPGDPIEIQLRVQNFLQTRRLHEEVRRHNELLEHKVKARTEHLALARQETVEVLSRAGEFRDDDTGQHCHRVGEMSGEIARQLKLDPHMIELIRMVAPLHDIGKIAVPDDVLRKPGKLTDAEYEMIKLHVVVGGQLLSGKKSPLLKVAREIAQYHHERWDGKGYADGLAGEDIPISARIVSVADTFDAITNDRPYRKARTAVEAVEEIRKMAGSQFDPNVVEALAAILEAGF